MPYHVYLAGPITGLSFDACVDWRIDFIEKLPARIVGLSPMRGKTHLEHETSIRDEYISSVMSSSRGIITRDFNDCKRADVIVANLLGASRVSIGTVMEIAWGRAFQTPVILVMEKTGNIHDHSMIRETAGYTVETLDDALLLTKAMLLPAPHRKPKDPRVAEGIAMDYARWKDEFSSTSEEVSLDPEAAKFKRWSATSEELAKQEEVRNAVDALTAKYNAAKDNIRAAIEKCKEWRMTDAELEALLK
jgi:nucleoside 2-deoxyribosyltransferase